MLNQAQIDTLYELIVEPDDQEIDYKIYNDHYKTALWLLHKLFS